MKCRHCSYDNQHNGIYCTDCGQSFIEIAYAPVSYFIRQELKVDLEIRNPLNDSLKLKRIVLGKNEKTLNEIIGRGIINVSAQFVDNSSTILAPELALEFEKQEKTFALANLSKRILLSPIPEVEIRPLDKNENFVFSPTSGFQKKFKVKLKNNACLRINGVLLIENAEVNVFEGPKSKKFWTEELPLIESGVDLDSSTPEGIITVDFSGLDQAYAKREFVLSLKNEFGANHEIFKEANLFKLRPRYQNLVPIAIGVLHATDKGFAYVVDNKVYRETGGKKDTVLIGVHPDYIDVTNWSGRAPNDASVQSRLAEFHKNEIVLRAPAGVKRKRRFALYQNFLSEAAQEHDLANNPCFVKIIPKDNRQYANDAITYRELRIDGGATARVSVNEELRLSDIRELNAFELILQIPQALANQELRFDLAILRKDGSSGRIVDEIKYMLVLNTFAPRPLDDFIAIDFGTSNTCAVGPKIVAGETQAGEPVCYPLNYFHENSDQITTFPTLIAYDNSETAEGPESCIPDSLFPAGRAFDEFKKYLPDELSSEEAYPGRISPLKLTIDFIEALLANQEIYFEDRQGAKNIFKNIMLTAPTGFMPEVREKIESELAHRLRRKLDLEYDIRMDLDEPSAVLSYVYETKQISFEAKKDEFEVYGIYDFGGGTTDTSFVLVTPEQGAILAGTGGSVYVGGSTVDRWLIKRLSMSADIADTRKAKSIELYELVGALKSADIENLLDDPQFALDASKIKHYFKTRLDKRISPPEDLLDDFPLANEAIFNASDFPFEILQSQIAAVAKKIIKDGEAKALDFWKEKSNVFIHLLFPFYTVFYRKVEQILDDSLMEAFEESRAMPASPPKVNIHLLLAGNASRIGYLEVIAETIFSQARKKYDFIKDIEIRMIDRPKEAVALGAYYSAQSVDYPINRLTNPPMTIFTKVHPLFRGNLVKQINNQRGIVIFDEGEKSKHPDDGPVLVRIFRLEELGINASRPQIAISKKVGIDIFTTNEKLKGRRNAPNLAFVLTARNKLEIFGFADFGELKNSPDFSSAIEGANMRHIEAQFKS